MEFISISSLSGFFTGFGLVLLIAIYKWRKGKKERRFDERYEIIHGKARTFSWSVTVVLLIVMTIGVVIYEGLNLAAILLAIVYVVILLTYWIAVAVLNKKV